MNEGCDGFSSILLACRPVSSERTESRFEVRSQTTSSASPLTSVSCLSLKLISPPFPWPGSDRNGLRLQFDAQVIFSQPRCGSEAEPEAEMGSATWRCPCRFRCLLLLDRFVCWALIFNAMPHPPSFLNLLSTAMTPSFTGSSSFFFFLGGSSAPAVRLAGIAGPLIASASASSSSTNRLS